MSEFGDFDASTQFQYLTLKVQDEILTHILPVLKKSVDSVAALITEPDDSEENAAALREIAVEMLIDELVKVLTHDPQEASKRYTFRDQQGSNIDTLIACYNELNPEVARRWFAQQDGLTPEDHARLVRELPDVLSF